LGTENGQVRKIEWAIYMVVKGDKAEELCGNEYAMLGLCMFEPAWSIIARLKGRKTQLRIALASRTRGRAQEE